MKNKTEEVLLKLGIAKVGHDDGIFQKVADNDSNMVKGWCSLPCIDVGLVKSDLWGRLLDRTLMDVMWAKQAP